MRRRLVGATLALGLAGCFAIFDFDGYDTSRPDQEAAADGATTFEPFTIGISGPVRTGISGETLAVEVAVQRSGASADPIVLGLSGANEVTMDPVTIEGGASTASARLLLGNRHGAQTISITGTSSANPGFTATAQLSLYVRGRPGTLDTTFAQAGVFETAFGAHAEDVAILPDDRILLAGGGADTDGVGAGAFQLVRLLANGSLDPTFGNGGRAVPVASASGNGTGEGATCLALAPDGTALVAGTSTTIPAPVSYLVALDPSGAPVPSFGDAGARDLPARCRSMHRLPDGRIVVAIFGGFVVRRLAGGEPDPTFGDAGTALDGSDSLTGATLDDTNTLLVEADTAISMKGELVALELGASGVVSSRFVIPAAATTPLPSCGAGRPVRLAGGTAILVGSCFSVVEPGGKPPRQQVLVALSRDGGLDPTFGDGGVLIDTELGDAVGAVAIDGGFVSFGTHALDVNGSQNEHVVVTGHALSGAERWRFRSIGRPDLATAVPSRVAVDHQGRLVVIGTRGGGPNRRAFVARLWL